MQARNIWISCLWTKEQGPWDRGNRVLTYRNRGNRKELRRHGGAQRSLGCSCREQAPEKRLPWQRTSGHREEESQPEGEAAQGEDDWIPVRWPEEEDKSKEGRLEKTSAAMDGWMHWRRNLTAKGRRKRGLLREEFWYTEIENMVDIHKILGSSKPGSLHKTAYQILHKHP